MLITSVYATALSAKDRVQGQDTGRGRCPNPGGGSNDAIGITAHGIVGAFVLACGTTVLSARDFLLVAVLVSAVLGFI